MSKVDFVNPETGEITTLNATDPVDFEIRDTGYYINASSAPYNRDCWHYNPAKGLVYIGKRVQDGGNQHG